MEDKIQKWRDHFAEYERDQLHDFPLHELETPIERAKYEIALDYFRAQCKYGDNSSRVVALRADEVTRRAFFDVFGAEKHNWFCFRSEGYQTLTSNWRKGSGVWPFQIHYHEFSDCHTMKQSELQQRLGEEIESFDAAYLYIRRHGFRDASRAGGGRSDLWCWNGKTLVHLPQFDSFSIS